MRCNADVSADVRAFFLAPRTRKPTSNALRNHHIIHLHEPQQCSL
jgi:hypothetical protein